MKRSNVLDALAALALPIDNPEFAAAAEVRDATGAAAADVVAGELVGLNAHDASTVTKVHAPEAVLTLLPAGKARAAGSDQLIALFTKTISRILQMRH